MRSFFITGTDTNIGKTAVTCSLIAKYIEEGFRVGGMKPVAAGCFIENGHIIYEDVQKIIEVSNVDLIINQINPYQFEAPIAPHISFKKNKKEIDIHLIKKHLQLFEKQMDYLFIEGAGGFAVPLTENFSTVDLIISNPKLYVINNCIWFGLLIMSDSLKSTKLLNKRFLESILPS